MTIDGRGSGTSSITSSRSRADSWVSDAISSVVWGNTSAASAQQVSLPKGPPRNSAPSTSTRGYTVGTVTSTRVMSVANPVSSNSPSPWGRVSRPW